MTLNSEGVGLCHMCPKDRNALGFTIASKVHKKTAVNLHYSRMCKLVGVTLVLQALKSRRLIYFYASVPFPAHFNSKMNIVSDIMPVIKPGTWPM